MKIFQLHYAICLCMFITSFHISGQTCDFEFSLGNDTIINCGASITLTAPDGYVYNWNTGSINQSITISQAGTYSVQVIETMESIVVNGDFSSGNTGFTSDYAYATGGPWGLLSNEGEYAVASNPNLTHNNFANCFDHTSGNASGSMLVANGSAIVDLKIWDQTVAVTPNTDYIFSVWATSVVSSNPGQLNFSINDIQVGETFELSSTTCIWENFFITWHSGSNTSAEISIVNQNTNTAGNDFALDDIEFSPICVSTDEIEVSIAGGPVLTLPPMQTICAGDSITLTATSNIEGSTFIWQPGSLQGSEITVSPNTNTEYTAIATSPQNCNSTPETTIVAVDNGPLFNLEATNDTLCPGEDWTFVVYPLASTPATTEYVITPGNITGTEFTVSSDTTTSYTITSTPAGGGCSHKMDWTINVGNPEVEIQGMTNICPGQTSELTATSTFEDYEYTWEPDGQVGNSIAVQPPETTTYTVSATSTRGCEAEAEYTVTVIPTVITVSGTTEICPGDTAFLSASANFPNFSYLWTPETKYGSNVQFTPTTTTTYTVQGNTAYGCVAQTQHTVVVSQIPEINITGNSEICRGDEVVLTAETATPGINLSYLWSTANTENQISVSPNTTTEYSVVVSEGNCASEPVYKTVIVNPVPLVFPPNDTLVCPGEPLVISASANIDDVVFYWENTDQFGDTIIIDPVNPGYYFVSGETEKCASVRRVFQIGLLETCGCTLTMPNVFTPNGDGKNDSFKPAEDENCQYVQFDLRVYNRWGKEVWKTSDFSKGWDGLIDGNEASEGVYFWTFNYSYTDGSLRVGNEARQGEVMLLKSKL